MNIIKYLATDFTEWEEYVVGDINENGETLRKVVPAELMFISKLKNFISNSPFDPVSETSIKFALQILEKYHTVDEDLLITEMKEVGIL